MRESVARAVTAVVPASTSSARATGGPPRHRPVSPRSGLAARGALADLSRVRRGGPRAPGGGSAALMGVKSVLEKAAAAGMVAAEPPAKLRHVLALPGAGGG